MSARFPPCSTPLARSIPTLRTLPRAQEPRVELRRLHPRAGTFAILQSVAPKIKHRTITPDGLAPGIYHDLGVSLGIGELGERAIHAVETDMAGDQRRAVDLSLGDVMQALCELLGRVAEPEWKMKRLG